MYFRDQKRIKMIQVVNIGMDIDEALSDTSENAVQNQVVTKELKSLDANRVKLDASNLTDENVESWKEKLSVESVENVETIYDMNSSDSSKNWGYTSGLVNETVVTGKDLSKYKRIRGYWYLFGAPSGVFEVDLTGYLSNICRAFVVLNSDSYGAGIVVSQGTGDITISTHNPPSGSNYIYKIEGVY